MDNLLKLAKDALTTVVFEDDSQIAELSARKVYGVKPQTVIRVAPLAGASEAHEPRRETLMAYFRDPSVKKIELKVEMRGHVGLAFIFGAELWWLLHGWLR